MGNDIDPRFDPAFQRGYKPKPGERSRTRVRPPEQVTSPPGRAPVAPRAVSPASDEVPWPDDEAEAEVVPAGHIVEVVSGVAVEQDYADEGAGFLAGVDTAPRRNRSRVRQPPRPHP